MAPAPLGELEPSEEQEKQLCQESGRKKTLSNNKVYVSRKYSEFKPTVIYTKLQTFQTHFVVSKLDDSLVYFITAITCSKYQHQNKCMRGTIKSRA